MLFKEGQPFIRDYISSINQAIKAESPDKSLSRIQCIWLSFILLGILVTNSVCWSKISRFGQGRYSTAASSWMFRKAQIVWSHLLKASVCHILSVYNVNYGSLQLDDTDISRSKRTPAIANTHKLKDKKTNGYSNGQNIIFLVLVAKEITIPVGFRFYCPDPKLSAWYKLEEKLRKQKVKKEHRPKRPADNPRYPTKKALGLELISDFNKSFPDVKIRNINADLFYGTKHFMRAVRAIYKRAQIISQAKGSQQVSVNNKFISLEKCFEQYHGKKKIVLLREKDKQATFLSVCLKLKSHGEKYRIVALKYDDETTFRYLITTDMTWLAEDIVKAYALRWLVEVFIQDWKSHEGWNTLAKQRGEIGSDRGVILSLMLDHALLLHDEQQVLHKQDQPAATVGSLKERVTIEALCTVIEEIVCSDEPKKLFEEFSKNILDIFQLRESGKHLRNTDMENMMKAA